MRVLQHSIRVKRIQRGFSFKIRHSSFDADKTQSHFRIELRHHTEICSKYGTYSTS